MHRHTNNGKSTKGRSCEDCRVCCVHLDIESKPGHSTRLDTGEDLAKAAHEPCRYLASSGCSIYSHRPIVCRQFACDWLIGSRDFAENHSPRATGVIGVRGVSMQLTADPIS